MKLSELVDAVVAELTKRGLLAKPEPEPEIEPEPGIEVLSDLRTAQSAVGQSSTRARCRSSWCCSNTLPRPSCHLGEMASGL
jgi:hypothetical protein